MASPEETAANIVSFEDALNHFADLTPGTIIVCGDQNEGGLDSLNIIVVNVAEILLRGASRLPIRAPDPESGVTTATLARSYMSQGTTMKTCAPSETGGFVPPGFYGQMLGISVLLGATVLSNTKTETELVATGSMKSTGRNPTPPAHQLITVSRDRRMGHVKLKYGKAGKAPTPGSMVEKLNDESRTTALEAIRNGLKYVTSAGLPEQGKRR